LRVYFQMYYVFHLISIQLESPQEGIQIARVIRYNVTMIKPLIIIIVLD